LIIKKAPGTRHAKEFAMKSDCNISQPKSSYKNIHFSERFEKLVATRGHRTYSDSRAVSFEESRFLARKLRHAIGQVAEDEVLARVLAHNPEVIRLVERDAGQEPAFLAYLPLNSDGLQALVGGQLDRQNPDTKLLTRAGEMPVALYIWCVYSPGNFIPAIAAIAAHFESIAPQGVPLFTSAATPASARLFASLGFARALDHYPAADADVLVVFRAAQVPELKAAPSTTTRVSRTIEDIMKVFAIRAATYMNEQACPYDEEFDGNDFCAAHILGEINGEPAGCIRIRFFDDFVKIERSAQHSTIVGQRTFAKPMATRVTISSISGAALAFTKFQVGQPSNFPTSPMSRWKPKSALATMSLASAVHPLN
jgi:hypothetical protein